MSFAVEGNSYDCISDTDRKRSSLRLGIPHWSWNEAQQRRAVTDGAIQVLAGAWMKQRTNPRTLESSNSRTLEPWCVRRPQAVAAHPQLARAASSPKSRALGVHAPVSVSRPPASPGGTSARTCRSQSRSQSRSRSRSRSRAPCAEPPKG